MCLNARLATTTRTIKASTSMKWGAFGAAVAVALLAGCVYLATNDLHRMTGLGMPLATKMYISANKQISRVTQSLKLHYYGDLETVRNMRQLSDAQFAWSRETNFCPVEQLLIKEEIGPALWIKCGSRDDEKSTRRRQRPLIVYIHGSGFARHNPENFLTVTMHLSNETKADVISLRYRLAPEHQFPTAVDDTIYQVGWILENAKKLNYDQKSVFLMGDSAGGNMIINSAIKYNDKIKAIFPIYPTVQAIHTRLPSFKEFELDPAGHLDKRDFLNYYSWYLEGSTKHADTIGENAHVSEKVAKPVSKYFTTLSIGGKQLDMEPLTGEDNEFSESISSTLLDYRLSPLIAPDEILRRLPRTYIYGCYYDILRDEGVIFTKRLQDLGVKVVHHMVNNCWHGSNLLHTKTTGGADLMKLVYTDVNKEIYI